MNNDGDFHSDALRAVEWIDRYLRDLPGLPVMARSRPGDVRRALPADPPSMPEPLEAVLQDIDSVLMPAMTHWNSPGFLAYFASSSSTPGILGELLAAAMNVNAMLWRTSPAATELEQVVTDWLRRMLGLPQPMLGVINDTASSSTLYALAAARHALAVDIDERGLAGRTLAPLRCYASQEAHSSVEKALMILGLGRVSLRRVSVDDAFRLRPDMLSAMIDQDVAAGCIPMAVIATAGTTSATAIDPVAAIAEVCEPRGIWLHVDAAYAGSAAVAPEFRHVLHGAERADSLVVNPHKWLFTPLDCSVLWTRRPDDLRGAFSVTPAYLTSAEMSDPDAPNLMDYGAALGRRFRALKLWMVIRGYGTDALAQRIRDHCAYAAALAALAETSREFELMAPVPLSVVCLRSRFADADETINDQGNERIVEMINRAGRFFVSHTTLHGRYVIRVAFGNLRNERAQVRMLWDELVAAHAAVLRELNLGG